MPKKATNQKPTETTKPGAAPAASENISAYFRKVFKQNPNWLKTRSNDEVLKRWLQDHPGEKDIPKSVKAGLQNVKGILRSKRRKKKKAAALPQNGPLAQQPLRRPGRKPSELETLEERIDDVLTFARSLEREDLEEVRSLLRKARNAVVWKLGQ
jgi:hypothetical protein